MSGKVEVLGPFVSIEVDIEFSSGNPEDSAEVHCGHGDDFRNLTNDASDREMGPSNGNAPRRTMRAGTASEYAKPMLNLAIVGVLR